MERVECVRCHVPESQSMVGGTKSACEVPTAGGRRRLILDGISIGTKKTISAGFNEA